MESFLGKSESIEKMIDPVDEIIIAPKKAISLLSQRHFY